MNKIIEKTKLGKIDYYNSGKNVNNGFRSLSPKNSIIMKKLLFLAIALAISVSAFSQTQFKFGVTGGMNLSKETTKFVSLGSKVGWNAGFIGEVTFASNIYGNVSALYSNKGFKEIEGDGTANTNYIEIPIHLGYKYNVSDKFSVLGEGGPYAGFLISAKYKEDGHEYKGTEDSKKLDVGIGLRAGVEINRRFRLMVGYDWGLANTIDDEEQKTYNRNFSVGMVVFF